MRGLLAAQHHKRVAELHDAGVIGALRVGDVPAKGVGGTASIYLTPYKKGARNRSITSCGD